MRNRVERLAPGQPVRLSTFHRFVRGCCASSRRWSGLRDNYTIYDTSDSLQALRRVIDEVGV